MDENVIPIRPGIEIRPNAPEGAQPVPKEVKLVLTINATMINGVVSDINIQGPIMNKILCFGLLAAAHDVVKEYNPNPNPSNLITPDPGIRNLLKI